MHALIKFIKILIRNQSFKMLPKYDMLNYGIYWNPKLSRSCKYLRNMKFCIHYIYDNINNNFR